MNGIPYLQFERILPILRQTVGNKRFLHSLGAMHYAVVLATRFGEDVARAATAGLLHDCGRLPEIEMVEAEARRRGLDLPEDDRPFPKTWHALLSAEIAARDYAISDHEILRAILLHSTGDAKMSRLEKIIFLSDYLEPTRRFEGLKELRRLAEEDLDAAFRRSLETKLEHIRSQGRPVHPRALRALADAKGSLES